eukprot:TRINITY_DN4737_c0_g3_i1.p1 TRINITY_DN4737_c0_g3~~TRINITY_DN4737_c0_g3_i1.p1  ORF type:complete len:728 (+),score=90.75 TRINITY_DN4737_c0_g3_i1:250-2184(+)
MTQMDISGQISPFRKLILDDAHVLYDAKGLQYWGDQSPDRRIELCLLVGNSRYQIMDYKRLVDSNSILDNSLAFTNVSRDITTFCNSYLNAAGDLKYFPYFCRNTSAFDDDMLRVSTQYLISNQHILPALYEQNPDTVAFYMMDIWGSVGYYPITDPDLGAIVGGDFTFRQVLFASPKFSADKKPVYAAPYTDSAGNGFIITAFAPIYFGEVWWGVMCADIRMSLTQQLIEDLKPTNNSLAILTDSTGVVILATDAAYLALFNLTPSTNIAHQSVVSNIQLSNLVNFDRFWNLTIFGHNDTFGQSNVSVHVNGVNSKYIVEYTKLNILKDWVLFVFAPEDEVYPPKDYVSMSSDVSLVILVMSMVFTLIPIGIFAFITYHRSNNALSSISPPFTLASVFGAILLDISPAFLSDLMKSCSAWICLLCVGYVLFFGGLLIKTYRIERIFTIGAKKFKKAKKLQNHHLFPGLIILVLVQIILLVIWMIISPVEVLEMDIDDRTILISCGSVAPGSFWGFFGAEFFYYFFIMVAACYFSFKTRNIYIRQFREAKPILFAVYNFTFIFIISIVVGIILYSNPSAASLVITVGTLFATNVSLVVWLGSRLLRVFLGQQSESSASGTSNHDTSSQNGERRSGSEAGHVSEQ